MVAVTYDVAQAQIGTAAPQAARVVTARAGKPWYVRFVNRLMEARTQQARREIARRIYLLPYSLDERGNRLIKAGAKDMPFGGW